MRASKSGRSGGFAGEAPELAIAPLTVTVCRRSTPSRFAGEARAARARSGRARSAVAEASRPSLSRPTCRPRALGAERKRLVPDGARRFLFKNVESGIVGLVAHSTLFQGLTRRMRPPRAELRTRRHQAVRPAYPVRLFEASSFPFPSGLPDGFSGGHTLDLSAHAWYTAIAQRSSTQHTPVARSQASDHGTPAPFSTS
jgi:hypothetical protein